MRFIIFLCLFLPTTVFAFSPSFNAVLFSKKQVVASAYVGPGDVYTTSPYAWYSCARAFTAAYASGGSNACLVQRQSDNAQCTTKFAASGFVDLMTAYCTSNTQTIAQFCNATTCRVMTAYDQTGNARDAVQATFGSAPAYTLSSSPTGTLPVMSCSATLVIQTSSTFTVAQPLNFSAVIEVTTGGTTGGIIGGAAGGNALLQSGASANTVGVSGGVILSASATDNAWHAVQGLANGASGAINADGSDTTGNTSTTGISATNIRLCRATGGQLTGFIAEAGFWNSATSSANRNSINANQHGSTGYSF